MFAGVCTKSMCKIYKQKFLIKTLYKMLFYQQEDVAEFVASACGLAQNILVEFGTSHPWVPGDDSHWEVLCTKQARSGFEQRCKKIKSSSPSRQSGPGPFSSSVMSLSCPVVSIKKCGFGLTAGGAGERNGKRAGFQFSFKAPGYSPRFSAV